ncbi:MAG: phosphoenolpyruvate mutase [Rhodospirillales bacterium]|nr:phosphoenolpyruvate mutase [Rhodospirillales bacterium]
MSTFSRSMTARTEPAPAREPVPGKAARLRALLESPRLEFLMEAHDGLSAKIVERAGFAGIWASGLSMSAALGVRDNNEASWTQVLEVLEFMADATSIPILVDGDTGWGNFNNLRRAVHKLCQRGIAGICIEDKLFPKTNSFIGDGQPLADIDEFCGKIKAGKDSQTDPDFQIVARIEALIAGWGMDEALKRAEAYRAAGADAVLIHSRRSTADEVMAFKARWGDRAPVVIVPTMYHATPTQVFRDAGFSVAIWANHTLRAAITGMQEICHQIRRDESLANVEDKIVTVRDVFALTGDDELAEAEARYLPAVGKEPRAIVLAASRGSKLGKLTAERPKCMIDIRGRPLLQRQIDTFHAAGIRDITVVRGYRKKMINFPAIRTVDNDLFATTGEAASLARAREMLDGECILAFGDTLFRHHVLDQVRDAEGDVVLGVDALWRDRQTADRTRDLVACSRPFSPDYLDDEPVMVRAISHELPADDIAGEWIGLAKLSARGAERLGRVLSELEAEGRLASTNMVDVFARLLVEGETVGVVYVTGHWMDVDDAFDLVKAGEFL